MDTLENNTLNIVKTALAEIGEENDINKIKLSSRLGEDLRIDSLDSIELIHILEDKFDIEISERTLDSSLTVENLILYIESKLKMAQPKTVKKEKAEFINNLSMGIDPPDTFKGVVLSVDKSVVENLNFNPYYRLVESGLGREIAIENKKFISLGSNDYLGLANNEIIKKEAIKIIEEYGMSMCGTPIVIGQTKINRDFELKIADFLKQDDAILYPSCYQANLGIFQLLTKEDDIIIADENIHSSLITGCKLSNTKLRFFPHNNMKSLEGILKNSLERGIRFIVIEGLYSTEGNIAPLDQITNLARQYDAFIIADDAHGIGVLGREGRGILEKYDAYNDVDLITGSLGKALGLFGGFLAGREKLIDYFRYNSSMYFYSTALPPYIAAAGMRAIDFVKTHNDLRIKIWGYKDKLFNALKNMGYRLTKSETPLFSILFTDSYQTIKMAKFLFERQIYVVPFIPPSVPKDSPRIRLLPAAYLKNEDIDRVIEVFGKLKSEYVTK